MIQTDIVEKIRRLEQIEHEIRSAMDEHIAKATIFEAMLVTDCDNSVVIDSFVDLLQSGLEKRPLVVSYKEQQQAVYRELDRLALAIEALSTKLIEDYI